MYSPNSLNTIEIDLEAKRKITETHNWKRDKMEKEMKIFHILREWTEIPRLEYRKRLGRVGKKYYK